MDDDNETYQIKPARINWADVAMAGSTFMKGIAKAAHDAWEIMEISFAGHSQHIMERQDFQRDAGRAIEALTSEERADG